MRVSGLLTDAFLLHVLLAVTSVPLHDGRGLIKHRKPTGWPQHPKTHYEKKIVTTYLQDNLIPPTWPKGEAKFRNGSRMRCGVPDYPSQRQMLLSGRPRQRRYAIFGGRWPKTDLTYRIQRFPWQMREDKVRRVMQDALKFWSDVTPLKFTEVINQEADIVIDFTRYWHGDNLPFDGPGGILAHAFFPRTHREGDIHFDYDESWTIGNELGTDLLQVAAHEFGHVLGLQHSRVPGAIMSPFYSFSYPLHLSEDDKKGIQYLYGARARPRAPPQVPPQVQPKAPPQVPPQVQPKDPPRVPPQVQPKDPPRVPPQVQPKAPPQVPPQVQPKDPPRVPPQVQPKAPPRVPPQDPPQDPPQTPPQAPPQMPTETNEIISTEPDACRTDFDAVSIIRGELFFFKSNYVWRIRKGRLQVGYPALASRHWRGIPENIDAAYEDKQGNIWFFEGSSYWMFDAEHKIAGPNHLQTLGLPVTHIQAAIRLKEQHGYQTYFFRSGSYWRLDQQVNRVETGFPRWVRQDWWGVPDGIDAAFQDENGFAIFISGRQYWKFDQVQRKVLEGYPRYVGPDFFGCRMP